MLNQPQAVQVRFENHPGFLAAPVTITVPMPDGLKVITVGGLTKLETLAGQVAASLANAMDDEIALARRSAKIALAILAECEAREQEPQKEGPDGAQSGPAEDVKLAE